MKSKLLICLIVLFTVMFFASCITINIMQPSANSTMPKTNAGKQITVTFQSQESCSVEIIGGVSAPNHSSVPDIVAAAWTWNGVPGIFRTYIKFNGISSIPSNAKILSATLSLYGMDAGSPRVMDTGNSDYPGSPYYPDNNNATWLKRVLSDWNEATITWANKPATTDANETALPASDTRWNFDLPNIDVTALVGDMVTQKASYGFCLQLQNENIYRSVSFYGDRNLDAAKRPKLTVIYSMP